MKNGIFLVLILLVSKICFSQEIIDNVVAVVGNEIILKSDVENQYIQIRSQGSYDLDGELKCDILEELMFQKLLYLQAIQDSVEVTDKEVEAELDRRISVFVNQLGSEKKMEEFYGKSITEIKNDFRSIIREQVLTQRVQGSLTSDLKVTPSEVKEFFQEIPEDSIPMVSAYFELSEIVFTPVIGKEEKEESIQKLNDLRDRILNGESFQTLAILYSEDPGSATNGGELGFVSRTDLVPEFASVAFNLTSPVEVSRVVETEYGYHIIQLIEKKGNMMNFRHILLTPDVSIEQISISENKAVEVYEMLKNDSISFNDAVNKFSDGESKFNNGKVINPYYGNTKLANEFVDPNTLRNISGLKVGEYSKPFLSSSSKGSKLIKIVRLDQKVEAHKANLTDDYLEIQEYAMQQKGQKIIEKWIENKLESTYIRIDSSFSDCDFKFGNWRKN
ncbi:MAG: peptidylprolyl isomerase [Bacteroidales bacterium]|nr:peptidylprolyl isomerase [Bacteroidales bacterium]MCK9499478.1 peptidylprolyl isomerase [Bacteroidales bacterium]MDY0315445.1 peptidylprolyl isomerase [Bacteroidales bacterium]NLB86741.1 peptidylprolyl isomerase [Bacteroidales bacterium]